MWILILTLMGSPEMGTGSSMFMLQVPGFTSEAACMSAAKVWLQQGNTRAYSRALCAKA